MILLIIVFLIVLASASAISYNMGRIHVSVDFAKDEDGYIDYKDCACCRFYHNVTDLPTIDGEKGFCDYCAENGKCFFRK